MRNRHYKKELKSTKSSLEGKLLWEQKRGKEESHRKLSWQELDSLKEFFPNITIHNLLIETKPIPRYKYQYSSNSLLKDINNAYKKNQKILVRNYDEGICELLKDLEISYKIQCTIHLN